MGPNPSSHSPPLDPNSQMENMQFLPQHDQEKLAREWAKNIAAHCVRLTCIEQIHEGKSPRSVTGDYSDVKVVTPDGKIPWNDVSRMSDDEMRDFMKQVVDRLYTVFMRFGDKAFMDYFHKRGQQLTYQWDEPQNLTDWCTGKWDMPEN